MILPLRMVIIRPEFYECDESQVLFCAYFLTKFNPSLLIPAIESEVYCLIATEPAVMINWLKQLNDQWYFSCYVS